MMRHMSIRSTGTMEYREIPLYASKRLTSEPPDRGEVYRHTFKSISNRTDRVSRGCRSYREPSATVKVDLPFRGVTIRF